MSDAGYGSLTVNEFLATLASDSPTPGGGSGAAVTGAMGAGLVGMLAALTLGRKKYAEHEELMKAIVDEAAERRETLLALAQEDAQAYNAVSAAFKLPKASDEDKATRREAIQTAMRGACEVPLKIMEETLAVIGLAKNAVQRGNVNAASDGAAGAEMSRAALKVASYNVRINLGSIKDEQYVKDVRTRLDEMMYMGTAAANSIDSHVMEMWS